MFGIVVVGLGEGDAVVGVVGEAGAEAVGLHAVVAGAVFAGRASVDAGNEAAFGVAGDFVGGNVEAGDVEVMGVVTAAFLDSVDGFIIDAIGFPSDVVAHSGGGHEVAFVGGIDEDFSDEFVAVEGGEGEDLSAVFLDAFLAVEPGITHDCDLVLGDVLVEDFFGDMGFEDPHRVVAGAVAALAFLDGAELFLRLLTPGFGVVVVGFDALIELAREPADAAGVTVIGPTESTAAESAEVLVGADHDHAFAHLAGLHCGHHGGGSAAIDDEVGFLGLGEERGGKEKGEEKRFEQHRRLLI